jgi:hypothetical protein
MGMIITEIRTIPEKYINNIQAFYNQIEINADLETRDDEDGFEHKVNYGLVKENTFDKWWDFQENINKTEDLRKEYLARAKAGRLVFIETDID